VQPQFGPLHLVILQSTSFCNINCSYCYLPDRENAHARMSADTLRRAARLVFESGLVPGDLHVVWHAGEPLTLGRAYYDQAIEIIEAGRPAGIVVHYGVQTNGTLIDDKWIDFFEAHDVSVGVSVDGPQDLHDASRRYRNGEGSYAGAARGIAKLRARNYPFHVIGVMTRASLDRGAEIYDAYEQLGAASVGLNVEELEAHNVSSSLSPPEARAAFRTFAMEFLERAIGSDRPIRVREFHDTMESLIAGRRDNFQVRPLQILTVAWNGDMSTFSPELLALSGSPRQQFVFGNVEQCRSLLDIRHDRNFRNAYRSIARGVELCAATCEYFRYCGGGAPINKLSETGSLEVAETMFCELTTKAWVDTCLNIANAAGTRFRVTHLG
jgi:uncharacterized protein